MIDHPLVGRTVLIGRNRRVLQLDTLVHEYPGKRLIFRRHLDDGTPVAAKFYLGFLRQTWEWLRGLRGARRLQASGVPAPRLHYAGYCRDATAWLTVLEWIDADEPWPPSTRPLARADHSRLIDAIVVHHEYGVVQNDMNWRNFVPRSGRLYTVDTDRLRRHRAPLGRRASLAHLVHVYASKSRIPEDDLRWAYRSYCEARGWQPDVSEESQLLKRTRRARVAQAFKIARRAARGWKHYGRSSAGKCDLLFDRRNLSRDMVLNIAKELSESRRPGPVSVAAVPPGYSVRAIREMGNTPLGPALSWLRPARAMTQAWMTILTLRRLGFSVPQGAALVHHRERGLTWLVSESIDNARPLHTLGETDADDRDRAVAALRELLENMQRYRIGHRDWSLGALGWDGERIWLLDLGNIRFVPWYLPGFERRWRREIEQLVNALAVSLQTSAEALRIRLDLRVS